MPTHDIQPDRPASEYGTNIPKIYGTTRVEGILLWAKPFDAIVDVLPTIRVTRYRATFAIAIGEGPVQLRRIWFDDNAVYGGDGGTLVDIDFFPGTETQTVNPLITEGDQIPVAYRGLAYIVCKEVFLDEYGNNLPRVVVEIGQQTTPTIASIYEDIIEETGLQPEDVNVTGILGTLEGYNITGQHSAKDILDNLRYITTVDIAEIDNVLVSIPRSQPDASEIPTVDALEDQDEDSETDFTTEILEETPSEVHVEYIDNEDELQIKTEYARRISGEINFLDREELINLPATLPRETARDVAERELYRFVLENKTFTIRLGQKYLYVAPGDKIDIRRRDTTLLRCRVESVTIGANYVVELGLRSTNISIYS